ncbi:MAG: hypothetical protein ACLFPV_11995 [Spirochaetaceae bacterium]
MSPGALGAQELGAEAGDPEDALARPRFMVYFFEVEPDTLTPEQEFLLYNSILTEVAIANEAVVILESPDPDVPSSQVGKEDLAQSIDADSWLHVIASGGLENLTIEFETFDMLRRESTGREIIRPGFVIDYRVLSVGLWDPMVTALEENYERVVNRTMVTISAAPGTRIRGLPGETREVGPAGRLAVSVPSSSTLSLETELPGHYQETRDLFVGIDPMTLDFDQVEKPDYGIDFRLSSLQFPGLRFWYFVVPSEIFVRAGLSTQAIGFYPIDNTESLIRSGSTLSFFEVDGGMYITPPEELFRLYATLGGYLRFVHPSLGEISLERDAAPGAITAGIAAEFSSSRRIRFFLEYQPAFILASDPDRYIDVSFIVNRYPNGKVPGIYALGYGLFDLRNLLIGVRYDF